MRRLLVTLAATCFAVAPLHAQPLSLLQATDTLELARAADTMGTHALISLMQSDAPFASRIAATQALGFSHEVSSETLLALCEEASTRDPELAVAASHSLLRLANTQSVHDVSAPLRLCLKELPEKTYLRADLRFRAILTQGFVLSQAAPK